MSAYGHFQLSIDTRKSLETRLKKVEAEAEQLREQLKKVEE